MSRTTAYGFRGGKPDLQQQFGNAWGWSPMVWGSLVRRYRVFEVELRTYEKTYFDAWAELWRLDNADTLGLQPWESLVLHSTYDRALVRADRFQAYTEALDMFQAAHSVPGYVCHLGAIANWIRELPNDVECVGYHGTSVSEDLWWVAIVEENEGGNSEYEGRPYDLKVDTGHWYVGEKP